MFTGMPVKGALHVIVQYSIQGTNIYSNVVFTDCKTESNAETSLTVIDIIILMHKHK